MSKAIIAKEIHIGKIILMNITNYPMEWSFHYLNTIGKKYTMKKNEKNYG